MSVALWQIVFFVWVTLSEYKWVISRLFRTFCAEQQVERFPTQESGNVLSWPAMEAASHSQAVLPDRNTLLLECIERLENRFILWTRVHQMNRCPACGSQSESFHSQYFRKLQDLAWQGLSVELRLRVRRYRCRNHDCNQQIFTERVPTVARRYARRTNRVCDIVRLIGYTAGGLPGSRLLHRLAIPISDDTVLRTVKCSPDSRPDADPVRRLGVDEWAWRKGQKYGTILVDLDKHRVVDLLPDRTADGFRTWLEQHPTVEVISRDRCRLYEEGADLGAPNATQVADRFHLLVNLSDAMERALEECGSQLQVSPSEKEAIEAGPTTPLPPRPPTQQQLLQEQRRQRRLECYERVVELNRLGYSQRAIAKELDLQRKTVRRWLRGGQFPERKTAVRKRPAVEDHAEYLEQRWNEGCHNATILFREIRSRGYKGGRSTVARYVSQWRRTGTSRSRGERPQRIAPKHAAILLSKPAQELSEEQRKTYDQLVNNCPTAGLIGSLAQDFRQALLGKTASDMTDWIRNVIQSGIGPLVRFGWGLKKDIDSVLAAVTTEWSNGQVEGQVNRLKTIKRQMYGRAGFVLLRCRVLPFTPVAST